eukprot:Gb_20655 [translate_table: standard]
MEDCRSCEEFEWEKVLEQLPQSPGISVDDLPPLSPAGFDIPWEDFTDGFVWVGETVVSHEITTDQNPNLPADPTGRIAMEFVGLHELLQVEQKSMADVAFTSASSSTEEDCTDEKKMMMTMMMDLDSLLAVSADHSSPTDTDSNFPCNESDHGVGNIPYCSEDRDSMKDRE